MEESMADFEEEINKSFREFKPGERVKATVVDVSEDEILVDLNTYSNGVIPGNEISDDPSFNPVDELRIGEEIEAVVLEVEGRVILSLKEARQQDAWSEMKQAVNEHTTYEVKVKEAVNGGVIAYVKGLRGFMPASMMALAYVEDPSAYVGKKLSVHIMEADIKKDKLILSAKDVAMEEAAKVHENKLNALQKGYVTEGIIERIEPYGCFVRFGDDLCGLVHISQISQKFLHSPNEVVKLGQKVKVKVLDIADGKIRLSMKEAEEVAAEIKEEEEQAVTEYNDSESATTSLGSLLAGIKLE
jgi:small subunit ribosomal protein S1